MDGLTLLAKIESAYTTNMVLNIFTTISTPVPLDYDRLQTVAVSILKHDLVLYSFAVYTKDPYTWTKEDMLFVLLRLRKSVLYDNILKFCMDNHGIEKDYIKNNMSKGIEVFKSRRNTYKVDNIRVHALAL